MQAKEPNRRSVEQQTAEPPTFLLEDVSRWSELIDPEAMTRVAEPGRYVRFDCGGLIETYDEKESWLLGIPLPFVFPRSDQPRLRLALDIITGLLGLGAILFLCFAPGRD